MKNFTHKSLGRNSKFKDFPFEYEISFSTKYRKKKWITHGKSFLQFLQTDGILWGKYFNNLPLYFEIPICNEKFNHFGFIASIRFNGKTKFYALAFTVITKVYNFLF